MSVRVQGWVWDQDFTTSELVVALKLADHADHDGGNIYPSVAEIAQKTKLSERQIKRYLKDFVDRGILVIEEHAAGGRGHARVYRFTFQFRPKGDIYDTVSGAESMTLATPFIAPNSDTGDTLFDEERVTSAVAKGDIHDTERVTPMVRKGDIHARANQNRPEPSKEPSRPNGHAAAAAGPDYIALFGPENVAKLTDWLLGLDRNFGGVGWVRNTLRDLQRDVPGLGDAQLKDGLRLGFERFEAQFTADRSAIRNPQGLARMIFRTALEEQAHA